MDLSVIIIFHNNQREAQRSLFALSKKYQKNIEGLDYEVLCVDSNSSEPLNPDNFKDLGDQFKFHRFTTDNPSPADAMQFGIDQAQSEHLCIMIDGAHIITPNVFNYFRKISSFDPSYFIYTHPFHLGEYYQNDNMMHYGYNQEVEDKLLEAVNWKEDGYALFDISNYGQSNGPFMANIFESNCLFISKTNLKHIGGLNTKFVTKGGGFINLDLFKRCVENHALKTTALLGEASFHQFHGGTSTNAKRESLIQLTFRKEYAEIIGKPYSGPIYNPSLYGAIINNSLKKHVPNYGRLVTNISQQGESGVSISILDYLNEIFPFKEEFYIQNINLSSLSYRDDKVKDLVEKLQKINPYNIKVLDVVAKNHFNQGEDDSAIETLNQILELDPHHINSHFQFVKYYTKNDNTEKAQKHLSIIKTLEDNTINAKTRLAVGLFCVTNDLIGDAEMFLTQGEKFKDSLDYLMLKILIAQKKNQPILESDYIERIENIRILNESMPKLINLAKILIRNKLPQLGLSIVDKVETNFRETQETCYIRGKYLFDINKFKEASVVLKRGQYHRGLNKTKGKIAYLLSQINKDFNTSNFLHFSRTAYNLSPTLKHALNYNQALFNMQSYTKSITILEKALSKNPNKADHIKKLITKSSKKIFDIDLLKKYSNLNIDELLQLRGPQSSPMIFTHIQKCGGSSLRRLIANAALYSNISKDNVHIPGELGLGPNNNLIKYDDQQIEELAKKKVTILADHSSFNSEKVKKIVPDYENAFNLTFFRRPKSRIVSCYYYFYFNKLFAHNNDYSQILINDLSPKLLNNFLNENANVATAFIAGKNWAPDLLSVEKEDLDTAKDNLHKFQFFGFTEAAEISIKVFHKVKPEWFLIPDKNLPVINKGGEVLKERTPSEAIQNKILKRNKLDIQLYNYALKLFIQKFKSLLNKSEIEKIRSLKIE